MSFSIQINGLQELKKTFSKSDSIANKELQSAMDESTMYVKGEIRNKIIDVGANNTGNLVKNVFVYESKPSRGRIGVGEKYGLYVEKGTKAHFPPVAPLERWAQTKLGKSGIGFLIARKIAREGTKAKPFVEPTFQKSKPVIAKRFDEATRKIVEGLAK